MTQAHPTRRVRAGRPPDNTGCLPVDFHKSQIDAWDHDEQRLDRSYWIGVAIGIASIAAAIGLVFMGVLK